MKPGRAFVLATLLAGCGGHDVVLGDGRPTERAEDPSADFGEPVPIPAIHVDGATDDDPSLTADLLELFFDSKREGGAGREDVWHATRPSQGAAWSAPAFVTELGTDARETGIAVSADGLTLFFSSDRLGAGLDVFVADRPSRDEPWTSPRLVEEVSSDADDLVSSVNALATELYVARRDGEDDDYDVFVARRATADVAFAAPSPITEVNTGDEQSDAFPIDGSRLLFTESEELALVTRGAPGGPFGTPRPLARLNSAEDDRDGWATPDFRYVVFSSDRSGEYELYEASR